MTRAYVEFEPAQTEAPDFANDSTDLVYFLSWAFSARYGANHELSLAALVLRGEFGIDLEPLLTFADRNVESPEDERLMDESWQQPALLAECCDAVAAALAGEDKRLASVREEYPGLQRSIEELAGIARWGAERELSLRLTYELSH